MVTCVKNIVVDKTNSMPEIRKSGGGMSRFRE
jgi:hypothetical protein